MFCDAGLRAFGPGHAFNGFANTSNGSESAFARKVTSRLKAFAAMGTTVMAPGDLKQDKPMYVDKEIFSKVRG